jgi:hypothetical protein
MAYSIESFAVFSARQFGWLAALCECVGNRSAAEAYLLQMMSALASLTPELVPALAN